MFAYLDPGTGSMVAGLLATGGAGAVVAAKSFAGKFRRGKGAEVVEPPADFEEASAAEDAEI